MNVMESANCNSMINHYSTVEIQFEEYKKSERTSNIKAECADRDFIKSSMHF